MAKYSSIGKYCGSTSIAVKKANIKALVGLVFVMLMIGGVTVWTRMTSDRCVGNPRMHAGWLGGDSECPAVGNVGGVKLAIPQAYLFGPVVYAGDDIWSTAPRKSRKQRPAFANEMENFAILVRLSNFRPIETRRDREDFQKLESKTALAYPPPQDRWIVVGLKSSSAYVSPDCRSGMRCYFEGILKDQAGWGPFVRQRDKAYGLDHYLSLQRPTLKLPGGGFDEFFYEPSGENSLITCSNKPMTASPHAPLEFCDHDFVIPELGVGVTVHYLHPAKEELPRWRDVEQNIRRIVKSFVVP
jgi:hypothetical protein